MVNIAKDFDKHFLKFGAVKSTYQQMNLTCVNCNWVDSIDQVLQLEELQ